MTVTSATIDTDGDGTQDALALGTPTALTNAAGDAIGTLTINTDGSFTFAPASNYNGPVPQTTYTLSDGTDTDDATLDITITPVNDAPVVDNENDVTSEDTPVNGDVTDGGDSDVDGNLVVTTNPIYGPNNGSIVINSDGTYTYIPDLNLNGADTVIVEICDDGTPLPAKCVNDTIFITVTPVNDAPTGGNEAATMDEDGAAISIDLDDNNIDVDGDLLTISFPNGNTGTGGGTFTDNGDGTVTYTPLADYYGSDSLIYEVCDPGSLCVTDTVVVTVAPVNDAPVAINDIATAPEDTPVNGNVLSNDTDIEGTALTVTQFVIEGDATIYTAGNTAIISNVGTIVVNSDGSYSFIPVANYSGSVPVITYTSSDGSLTDTATLEITVTSVNNPPVAGVSTMASPENPGGTNYVTVLANSFSGSDIDGIIASLLITSMPTNVISISVSGITYTTIPVEGISVQTTPTGQPLSDIEIDPIDGAVSSVVSYYVVDNEGLSSVASGTVTVPFSVVMTINAGPDISTCFNQPIQVVGASAYWYSSVLWTTNGNGTLENANTLSPTYVPADTETGEVILKMEIVGEGTSSLDTITDEIVLTIYPQLLVDVGPDDSIYVNTSAELNVVVKNGSGRYYYQWEPVSLVKNDKSGFTETENLSGTTKFEVEVTDINTGCSVFDSKTVYVVDNVEDLVGIYNAFTPNGDGVNDSWTIRGIEKFPDNVVRLFNIWGDKVNELNHYDNVNIVWFGENEQGKLLPDGTYYFVVTLSGVKSYSGWVQIKGSN